MKHEINTKTALLIVLCLICTVACRRPEIGLTPISLQCEYQSDPTGIDVPEPRLSWQLNDYERIRGQAQTAYHILMASAPELLTETGADVWNSERVASPQSFLVPYGGKTLQSSSPYFWKVRVFDKDGKPSEWSETAQFVTGILNPAEWDEAEWIRHPDAPRTKHIWFRRNLPLRDLPQNAFIHVASLGHHELYVNGERADYRALAPALTNFNKRLFYVTYDIAPLLREGDNTIAVWFASGWASYDCFSRTPALRVLLSGRNADGSTLALASDETWRCAVSNSSDTRDTITYNNNGGEIVDARLAQPEWNLSTFDDSQWPFAAIAEGNDDVQLAAHDIPASRIFDMMEALNVSERSDGAYQIDFGRNFTGWVEVSFYGLEAGDTVVIGSADDNESFDDFNIRNYFVSSGQPVETFSNRFNYIAGRYLNLKGLRNAAKLSDARAFPISTALEQTGMFISENRMFEEIYNMDLWTFIANTTEGYTSDCPHRERCGYGEEATATSWGIGLPNYDAGAFYRNVVRNWRDVQTEDGWGRHTAPQPNDVHWGGAMWSSAGMNVAWEHFKHYGDKQILEIIYPTASRWLDFLYKNTRDGLVVKYRKHPGQFLGDWIAPGLRNDFGDSEQAQYFNNCVYAMNLQTFIKMAQQLEIPGDVELYTARLNALRDAIHARFYDPATSRYCDGTQVQQAFALLTGVVPPYLRETVERTIVDDMNISHPYFDMGSAGIYVMLRYFEEHPELSETVMKILNSVKYPGYGYFIKKGETTWPEDWTSDVPSKIHTCYTGIAGWFTKSLCGIRPDENGEGYRHFTVKPAPVWYPYSATAWVQCPYGEICVSRECEDDYFFLTVTVPPNTSATICIPEYYARTITESSVPIEYSEGITVTGLNGGYFILEVQSGKYYFTASSAK
ncbi:MAG: glycoside hydrolase family 78 protein [Tannerella sp.]|jgi:alpha-L-rhamnosidase|nr:glycoside hydrolase family 78 protein [Tannerella sp.]